jgi:excisionase family DNA binding protein
MGEDGRGSEDIILSGRRSLLDVKWVARTFSVSEQWVYRMVETNQIPHYRLGKLIRFHHPRHQRVVPKPAGRVTMDELASPPDHEQVPISTSDTRTVSVAARVASD